MNLFFLVAYLQIKGILRAARYGIQILLLPMLMISIFLTAYLAVRTLGGKVSALFFPFVVFILSATAINIPMQVGNQLLSDSSSANLLITSRGICGLLAYFIGSQAPYLLTTLISIIISYFFVLPKIYFLNSIIGSFILMIWCIAMILIGLAMGMRFVFAFHLAQIIFLGFYPFLLMLSLTGKLEYAFVLPPVGVITIFQNEGSLLPFSLVTSAGTTLYILAGIIFLKWAYQEYRIGKGVNRI
ncbi:MAG: hypothetical protein N3A65_04040 [candidate division WOR-3 bacterium]|nr:hypothetical protein [candidate division WOR-3 bacterium]